MSMIYLCSRGVSLPVELVDSPTAAKIMAVVPFASTLNTWGDEIYFHTPVASELEKGATADVEIGDVVYWPPGQALCVFFGPTPASTGSQPRAASPVTQVGRIRGDVAPLRQFKDGDRIRVTLVPQDQE